MKAGDELLRTAARALREAVRQDDVVARLGGDEFGVLAVEAPAAQVSELAVRIEAALRERKIRASAGYAVRDPRVGIATAVREADSRMYGFKKEKRFNSAAISS